MRFSSSSLQFLVTATSEAKMSSSCAPYRCRNPWQRGFSDRPNRDMSGCVSGDTYIRSVEDGNYASGQVEGGNFRNSGGFQRQNFPQPPPPFQQPQLSQFQYQQPYYPQHQSHSHHRRPFQPQPSQQQSTFPQSQPPPPFQQLQSFPQQHLHQTPPFQPRPFRPPNYKPPDYRNWEYALSQPPSECERFVVLSYNILADYLAKNHRRELYWHIPYHILDWEWRKRKILFELGLWSPDIMSLQEVDRFQDLEEELKLHGYSGIWKMRTGVPVDGCAIFWRTTRFTLLHEESIEFNKLGLRDNIAQICVLESRNQKSADSSSDALPQSSNNVNRLVVCNIHVLYNPRRGEMKLGQVRALLERAYAVSKLWDDAPVVICGDFNCTPKSSLYNFISEQKLDLKGLARDHISGQSSAEIQLQRPYTPTPRHGSFRVQTPNNLIQAPTLADEKKEACLKPENCTHDMRGHNKPNTCEEIELISNNLNQSQSSTSMVDKEISDVSSKGLGNEIIDNLKNEVSCVTGEPHPIELRSDIIQDLTASLTKCENPDSVMVENGHGDQSNGSTVHSLQGALPENSQVNLHASYLIVSTTQDMSVHDDMDKETTHLKDDITSFESNVNFRGSRPDKIENALDQESISDLVPDTLFAGDKEVSMSEGLKDSSLEEDGSTGEAHISIVSLEVEVTEGGSQPETDYDARSLRTESSETDEYLEKQAVLPSDEIQDSTSLPIEANTYDPSSWTPMEIKTATGNAECTLVEHPLKLRSTYTEVEDYSGTRDSNREPRVTSYHRKFMGTVDYIWRSEGLQTVKVLDTIPKHALQWTPGFPTPKWGSDHIALVSQLAFTKGGMTTAADQS